MNATKRNATDLNVMRPLSELSGPEAEGDEDQYRDDPDVLEFDEGLSVRQKTALILLVHGSAISDAARSIGISRTSLWRWMQNPVFAGELQKGSDLAYEQALRTLAGSTVAAVDVLHGLLKSRDEAVQLRAAASLIGLAIKARSSGVEPKRRSPLDQLIDELAMGASGGSHAS